jgi:1-phosphatidylinositol-4-phosphate 5-kinase
MSSWINSYHISTQLKNHPIAILSQLSNINHEQESPHHQPSDSKAFRSSNSRSTNNFSMLKFHNENDFTFRDYCPYLFKELRLLNHITDESYMEAFIHTPTATVSMDRTGGFTYYSTDEKFVVRTISKTEFCKLLEILPQYFEYLKNHPNSLLPRYTSAHSMIIYGNILYVVVSMKFTGFDDDIAERYVLDGSWVGRNGYMGDKYESVSHYHNCDRVQLNGNYPIYKDNDLHSRINLHPEIAVALCRQIRMDIATLRGFCMH